MNDAHEKEASCSAAKGGVGARLLTVAASSLLLSLFYAPFTAAHEYWLSPISYSVDAGKTMLVDIRNGDNFVGSSFPYQAENFDSITFNGNGQSQPISSRLGDYPAIHPTAHAEGLYSIALTSTERKLVYATWDKFYAFLSYHDLSEFVARHHALRFPLSDIKEHYYRYAKTFVRVVNEDHEGDAYVAKSSDDMGLLSKIHGQELEIRFTANPYTTSQTIALELLYQGEPLGNRQVELFSKTDSVKRVVTKTDAQGRALFDNVPSGEHMLNAVHMVSTNRRGVHWKTLWASVTLSTMN